MIIPRNLHTRIDVVRAGGGQGARRGSNGVSGRQDDTHARIGLSESIWTSARVAEMFCRQHNRSTVEPNDLLAPTDISWHSTLIASLPDPHAPRIFGLGPPRICLPPAASNLSASGFCFLAPIIRLPRLARVLATGSLSRRDWSLKHRLS